MSGFLISTYWRGFRYCISVVYLRLLCQRWSVQRCTSSSLGLLSCSIGLHRCSCVSTTLSWWVQLWSTVWSQEGPFLQLHFSSSSCSGSFVFPSDCEFFCSSSVKSTIGNLIPFYFVSMLIPLVLSVWCWIGESEHHCFSSVWGKIQSFTIKYVCCSFFFNATY